ncbi:MAG: lipopolysaccharide export system permease protein [Campylobacterota bacterium]|nr:lipopolysaccharide export system permease protein [Campylobacterota bacterium]
MVNVKGYISTNFAKSFLTVFLPFFLIISLVYLVKIASLTAQIQISFTEMFRLYSYTLPDIIFYTLPLSFVAALTNVLMRLSLDNELVALYALGLRADKVLRSLFILGTLFSLLLLFVSFLAMPLSKQYYQSFKTEKQAEAKLNIVPGKLGQKFGDYYVYVKENKDDVFHTIVIYNRTKKDQEQFFSSHSGKLNKEHNQTSLLLNEGYGYTYTGTKLQQAQYKLLEVFDTSRQKDFRYQDIFNYWAQAATNQKLMGKILFFIFVSLIPLLCIHLVASFAMINPRYDANHSFLIIFLVALFFYFIASSLDKWGNFLILFFAIFMVALLGKWLFKKRVARYF